jgi:hypothetical protein
MAYVRLVSHGALIGADRPVEVAAYTVGQAGGGAAGIGDPSLSILDPVVRWEREVVAYLPQHYDNSIAIVAPVGAVGSVLLDGSEITDPWEPVGDGDLYQWVRLDDVAGGEHRIRCDEPFFVLVSGYSPGGCGAYSYPAIAINPDGERRIRIGVDDVCRISCPGDCRTVEGPGGMLSYDWSTGDDTPQVTLCPEESMLVSLEVVDADGCTGSGEVLLSVAVVPDTLAIEGPEEVCEGECVDLTATAGHTDYRWSTGDTGQIVTVCPDAFTTYRVTAIESTTGCEVTAEHTVSPYPPPVPGEAVATPVDPCVRGIEVSWDDAVWRPGSPGGVYNVYRREGDCAPGDDPSWAPLATGLSVSPYLDESTEVGVAYSYLVEAEDAPAEGACRPGPAAGGPTDSVCATPAEVVDPGDPDEDLLVSLTPYLRAIPGSQRDFPGDPATSVEFTWALTPGLDPRTHFEVWRSDVPSDLLRNDPLVWDTSWTDRAAGGARLLFYEVYNATECGTLGPP